MDDILSIIFCHLPVLDLLNIRSTNKYYNSYICNKLSKKYIIKLKSKNIDKVCLLNNGIGINKFYYDLNLCNNTKITDESVKCLINLTSLDLCNNTKITDESIKCLTNLTSLDLCYNTKIR